MKKQLILFVLLVTGGFVFAAKGLVVTQKYITGTDGQHITVTWYVTETQCKLKMLFSDKDVNSVTYFIPDAEGSKLLTYSDGPVPAGSVKTYFSIPVKDIKTDTENKVNVQRSGELKTLSGMNCEKMVVNSGNTVTEMWVTKDFTADYYRFASFFRSSYELKGLSEGKIKGFPLSSVTRDNTGKVLNGYELISVTSADLADTEFTVPAEYKSAEEVKAKK